MSIILTCNAGSSNIKLATFDAKTHKRQKHIMIHANIEDIIEWVRSVEHEGITAIGHRVVHGGREFTHPVTIDDAVLEKLRAYIPLAPLHQPAALEVIGEMRKRFPDIAQIACFDTAFHHTVPAIEQRLPLPLWFHQQGIQRYGFHGLSYQYIAKILPQYAKNHEKVIVIHLGGGASACAMKNLKSIATTMGFSTLDGLMMSTRCGALDPGVLIYLEKELEMMPQEVNQLLYLESGLQGVSGISGDMKTLLASEKPAAREAIDLYCYLAAKQIGGLLPALGGIDAVVFTGGIGENAAPVREQIMAYLRWAGDFQTYVIPTDEEAMIESACHDLLA